MVEALERKTFWNDGSSYFQGDWISELTIPVLTVAASTTSQQDRAQFADSAFIYLIEIDTASPNYEFKVWNRSARSGNPLLHLVKTAALTNYRRLLIYDDWDRAAELHYDVINNDSSQHTFEISLGALRQI